MKYKTETSESLEWTAIVLEALAAAVKHPHKTITIDVATEDSYELIAEGNEAAWRIRIQKHTLH